ncbi:MAG: cytochrome c [Archangium sp.]|nr:cytochrome c [Archangium sp.]
MHALFLLWLAAAPLPAWKVPPAALKGVKNPVPAVAKAASVERGQVLYAKECSSCHGALGKGDGPDGMYFTTPPSDLTAPTVKQQSDAELFVKLTQGRGDMKSYEKVLDAAQRWDLINAVRAMK